MNMVFWPWLINLCRNGKYGNHFVSTELRIWYKHCFVYIPSFHLHFHLHARTLIRFSFLFTREAMPQVKILGIRLVCWQLFLLPTITSGVECELDLFCRHGEVFPWVLDRLQSRSLVIYKAWEGSLCFYQDLSTCSEMYNGRKFNIPKLLQTFFPTHQESSILKTRTRRYGKNIERCAVWNQPWTDCIAGVK
jgi:hypothetical protein